MSSREHPKHDQAEALLPSGSLQGVLLVLVGANDGATADTAQAQYPVRNLLTIAPAQRPNDGSGRRSQAPPPGVMTVTKSPQCRRDHVAAGRLLELRIIR